MFPQQLHTKSALVSPAPGAQDHSRRPAEQPGRPVEDAVATQFLQALEPLRLKLKPGGPASLLLLTDVTKLSWRNPVLEKILSAGMA